MVTISKAQMLADIVESGEKPFRIEFVKSTGKDAGRIVHKNCYYGAPKPKYRGAQGGLTETPVRKDRKTHLESNTIPLTEFGTETMVTPLISHITKFNGKQVIH